MSTTLLNAEIVDGPNRGKTLGECMLRGLYLNEEAGHAVVASGCERKNQEGLHPGCEEAVEQDGKRRA